MKFKNYNKNQLYFGRNSGCFYKLFNFITVEILRGLSFGPIIITKF